MERKNMSNYFWKSATLILLAIMSFFAGFTAKGIDFTCWTPMLSVKFALVCSLVVLLVQVPSIISAFIDYRRAKNER